LTARHDAREVVIDPKARFFGAEVDERSLLPGSAARIAPTRFDDWLRGSVERAYATLRPPGPSITERANSEMLYNAEQPSLA